MKRLVVVAVCALSLLCPISTSATSSNGGGPVSVTPGGVAIHSTLTMTPSGSLRGDTWTQPQAPAKPGPAPASWAGRPCYPNNATIGPNGNRVVREPVTFQINPDGSTEVSFPNPRGGTAGPFHAGAGVIGEDVGPPGAPQTWGSYLATHTFVDYVQVSPGHYVADTALPGQKPTASHCDQQWAFDVSVPSYLPPTGLYSPPVPCANNSCGFGQFFSGNAVDLVASLGTGDVRSLPASGAPTFVRAPTCAWLETGLPQGGQVKFKDSTIQTQTVSDGRGTYKYDVFLEASITGQQPQWSFGDGQTSSGVGNDPGNQIPQYDATTQSWPPQLNPCNLSHAYSSTDTGRTITASERVTVTLRAFYNFGGGYGAKAVACPGNCAPVISPNNGAPGWVATHPVFQIQGIPIA